MIKIYTDIETSDVGLSTGTIWIPAKLLRFNERLQQQVAYTRAVCFKQRTSGYKYQGCKPQVEDKWLIPGLHTSSGGQVA